MIEQFDYIAKPNLNNFVHSVKYDTIEDCVQYLNEYTGVDMKPFEWCDLGKIIKVYADGSSTQVDTLFGKPLYFS